MWAGAGAGEVEVGKEEKEEEEAGESVPAGDAEERGTNHIPGIREYPLNPSHICAWLRGYALWSYCCCWDCCCAGCWERGASIAAADTGLSCFVWYCSALGTRCCVCDWGWWCTGLESWRKGGSA